MSEQTIESRIISTVADQLGLTESDISASSKFVEDLGADSLDEVELVMAIEEEFDIEISDEDGAKLKTVQDVIDHVTKATES